MSEFRPGDLITIKKSAAFPMYCTTFSGRAVFILEHNQIGLVVQHNHRDHLVGVMWERGIMGWINHQIITPIVEVV